jgi:hypothetical protein
MRSSLLTFATDLLDEGPDLFLAPLDALDWVKSALPAEVG